MRAHAAASRSRSFGICLGVWVLAVLLNIPTGYFWVSIILMPNFKHVIGKQIPSVVFYVSPLYAYDIA